MKNPLALFLLSLLAFGFALYFDYWHLAKAIVGAFYILPLVLNIIGLYFSSSQKGIKSSKATIGTIGNVLVIVIYIFAIFYAIIRSL